MAEKDYSGTPLWKKLGIRDGSAVFLLDPPDDFADELGAPAGVTFTAKAPLDVIVVFATAAPALADAFRALPGKLTEAGGLWIAWPKKTSKIRHDLDFEIVQELGLDAGLVDNKSCRFDDDWQGLRFVRRLRDRR